MQNEKFKAVYEVVSALKPQGSDREMEINVVIGF